MADPAESFVPDWFSHDPRVLRATLGLVFRALDAPELSTEFARLCAIWSLIIAMKPLAAEDIVRGQEIHRRLLEEAEAIRVEVMSKEDHQ